MQAATARFITFEGGEGAGKSTQVVRTTAWLRGLGVDVVQTREPGGAPGAELIRNLLVQGEVDRWEPWTETLLHYAARSEHVARTIKPALAEGRWVVCDRFADSTAAYQGVAGGIGLDRVDRLHELSVGDFAPDLTLVLDLPVEQGLARAGHRDGIAAEQGIAADRYERMGRAFHEKVRAGLLEIAANAPERCRVVDAARDPDAVGADIRHIIAARFGLEGAGDG